MLGPNLRLRKILKELQNFIKKYGGEGEIRTPDTVARMPHFECGAFNHSATSPGCEGRLARWLRPGGYHGLGGSSSTKNQVFD
jgi:hypothetical protein